MLITLAPLFYLQLGVSYDHQRLQLLKSSQSCAGQQCYKGAENIAAQDQVFCVLSMLCKLECWKAITHLSSPHCSWWQPCVYGVHLQGCLCSHLCTHARIEARAQMKHLCCTHARWCTCTCAHTQMHTHAHACMHRALFWCHIYPSHAQYVWSEGSARVHALTMHR
jgi:hypothetical protein